MHICAYRTLCEGPAVMRFIIHRAIIHVYGLAVKDLLQEFSKILVASCKAFFTFLSINIVTLV